MIGLTNVCHSCTTLVTVLIDTKNLSPSEHLYLQSLQELRTISFFSIFGTIIAVLKRGK